MINGMPALSVHTVFIYHFNRKTVPEYEFS